jgi:hypothetical protein
MCTQLIAHQFRDVIAVSALICSQSLLVHANKGCAATTTNVWAWLVYMHDGFAAMVNFAVVRTIACLRFGITYEIYCRWAPNVDDAVRL